MKSFISCLFLMSALSLSAGEQRLKVGLGYLDYPPFYFTKEEKITGAAIEISEAIASGLGYELTYERFPWKRVQRSLETGRVDMMILYFKTPERERHAYFSSTPHINESSYLFVKKGFEVAYKPGRLDNLKQYTFANIKGYSHGKLYDNADFLKKYTAKNEENLVKMVAKQRVAIGVGNKPALLLHAEKNNLQDKIVFFEPPIDTGANYFAFTKARQDSKELAEEFSAEVERFIKTDRYKGILEKYNF